MDQTVERVAHKLELPQPNSSADFDRRLPQRHRHVRIAGQTMGARWRFGFCGLGRHGRKSSFERRSAELNPNGIPSLSPGLAPCAYSG